MGPVDIVVEKNKIKSIQQVGYPGVPIDPKRRPVAKAGDKELNCEGMYLMPGFIDMHGHTGGRVTGYPRRVRVQAVARPRHHHHP